MSMSILKKKKRGSLMSAPMGRNDATPQIKSIFQ